MNETALVPQAALAALRRRAALASCETWRPQPGDTLEGVLTDGRKIDGPFGTQTQAIVQPADGSPPVAVWLTPWLLSQFREQGAALGDLLSLTFHGQARSKRGMAFNRYSLAILKSG